MCSQQRQPQFQLPDRLGGSLLRLSLVGAAAIVANTLPSAVYALSDWNYNPSANQLEVTVKEGVKPRYFLMAQPARIVLDLPDTSLGQVRTQQTYDGAVRQIRISQQPSGLTRIVMELSPDVALAPGQVKLEKLGGRSGDIRWGLRPLVVGAIAPQSPRPITTKPISATSEPAPPTSTEPQPPTDSAAALSPPPNPSNSKPPDSKPLPVKPRQAADPGMAVDMKGAVAIAVPPAPPTATRPPAAVPTSPAIFPARPAGTPPAVAVFSPLPGTTGSSGAVPTSQTPLPPSAPAHPPTSTSHSQPAAPTPELPVALAANTAKPSVSVPSLDTIPATPAAASIAAPPGRSPASPPVPSSQPPAVGAELAIPSTLPSLSARAPVSVTVPALASVDAPAPVTGNSAPAGDRNLSASTPFPPPAGTAISPAPALPAPAPFPVGAESVVVPTLDATMPVISAPALSAPALPAPALSAPALPAPALPAPALPAPALPAPALPAPALSAPVSPPAPFSVPDLQPPLSSVLDPAVVQSRGMASTSSTPAIVEFGQPLPLIPGTSLPQKRPPLPVLSESLQTSRLFRPAAPDALLSAGALLNLRYPGTQPLKLTAGTPQQEVLMLQSEIRDANGNIVVPEGSMVTGRFETNEAGSRFIAQSIFIRGQNVPLLAQSENVAGGRRMQQDQLAINSGIGALAGGLVGGLSGNLSGWGVLGGAATAAALTYFTAPRPATIQPGQVFQVRLLDDLR